MSNVVLEASLLLYSTTPQTFMKVNPHGILPEGNALVAGSNKRSLSLRLRGIGNCLWRLTDETLLDILSFLDGRTLVTMSETSRLMHVVCSQDYLWREIVLSEFGSRSISFCGTWKQSYYNQRSPDQYHNALLTFKTNGLISGHLFRQWLCGAFNPEKDISNFLKFNDIPRMKLADIGIETFIRDFEEANRPIVISGMVDHWPAVKKWTPEYLSQVCGDRLFRATSAAAGHAASFTMHDYISYARQVQEEAPLYLFERDFASSVSQLATDYDIPLFFNQQYLQTQRQQPKSSCQHYPDLFSILGEDKRPDYRWLVCGPAGSGSLFHIDPNQTHAWNVSLQGRKKWIFYPPHRPPPGVESSADGAEVIVPISTSEWLLTFWAFHLEARHDPDIRNRPLEVLAMPGDLVFVPHGWWHMVENLDFCVALTHNFVSSSNLSDCLCFLRDQRDQVSGVRDRSLALQPEELYEEFVQKLQNHLPQDQLDAALKESLGPSLLQRQQQGSNSRRLLNDNRNMLSRSRRGRKGTTATTNTSSVATDNKPGREKSFTKKTTRTPDKGASTTENIERTVLQSLFCFNFDVV